MNCRIVKTCALFTSLARHTLDHAHRGHQVYRLQGLGRAHIHTSSAVRLYDVRDKDQDEKEKRLIVHQGEYFDEAAKKARDKKTFHSAMGLYIKRNAIYRRGHVEFLYAAISRMKEFNVHRDLETYKQLMTLFPEGKMVSQNAWQVEMMHFPKQQQCCIDILDYMESNGVVPDDDMGYQLIRIFGKQSHVFRKYQRMMYWMPKFKYANPYYVPYDLPSDDVELAKMALKRMSVDLGTAVSVHKAEQLENCADRTFIVSAQSPDQKELLACHPLDKPVFVEGGYTVWMRSKSLIYFILRSECTEKYIRFAEAKTENTDELTFKWSMFEEDAPKAVAVPPSVHEQEDGTILAMAITGTSSKDSLTSWIRFLEITNDRLVQIPVVFRLRSPESGVEIWEEKRESSLPK